MPAQRLFQILYYMLGHRSTSAKELSELTGASVRTIYRDMETLCEAGIPIYTLQGKGGGIHLCEDYVLDSSLMTRPEQQQLLLALQGLQSINTFVDTTSLDTKLKTQFGNNQMDWIALDLAPWHGGKDISTLFKLLKSAIFESRSIRFLYHNSRGETTSRTIDPYRLVYRGQAWYLEGYCQDKQAMRIFKLTRMQEVRLTAKHFSDRHQMEIPTPYESPMTELLLEFSAQAKFRVMDEFETSAITCLDNGNLQVHTSQPEQPWLLGWLLSFGPEVKVIKPLSLQLAVKEQALMIAAQYNRVGQFLAFIY